MTWIHQGFNNTNGVAGPVASVDVPMLATVVPGLGYLGLARVLSAYAGATTGVTAHHTGASDTRVNVWRKLFEYARAEVVAGDGQIVSLWFSRLENGLSDGFPGDGLDGPQDTVTFTFATPAQSSIGISLAAYDSGAVDQDVEVVDAVGAVGTDAAPVVADTISPAEQYPPTIPLVWVGTGCNNPQSDATVSFDADYYTDRSRYRPLGSTGPALWGQFREQTNSSDSWDVSLSAARPWIATLTILRVVPFVPPGGPTGTATPGPREYQVEFESPLFGVSGTSTTRRPDAVSLDYLTAHSTGPVDVEDVSSGLLARRWRIVAIPWPDDPVNYQQVLLSRTNAGNTAWEAATSLFIPAAPFGVEFALCFDEAGRPVVACERPTGVGGASEVWIRDEVSFRNLGSGRTPRLLLDLFPYTGTHCPPFADVQLVYLKLGVGIKRREQRESFATEHSSPVTDDTDLYLEEFFPLLATRQLRLVYSRRNRPRGRYTITNWLDSQPYNNHLLSRPSFAQGLVYDLAWYRGELFRGPSGSTTTENFTLRVNVVDNVSGIQLQCADSLPSGVQPDSGGIWTVQNQDSIGDFPGGIGSGSGVTFTVSVQHGLGTMSPISFRSRTYQIISGITCYSPWRYWFSGEEGLAGDFDVVATPVNCAQDTVVCFPVDGFFIYQYAFLSNPPNLCADPPVTDASSCTGNGFFAGGWQPFPPLWRQDWSVQVRSLQQMSFSDPDGSYTFGLLGRAWASAQSGAGQPLPNADQSPLQVPA